jgi:HEAT repeat protein
MGPYYGSLERFLELHTPAQGPGRSLFRKASATLNRRGVKNLSDLLKQYDRLNRNERFLALCALSHMNPDAVATSARSRNDWVEILLNIIISRDALLGGVAVGALASLGRENDVDMIVDRLRDERAVGKKIRLMQVLGFFQKLGRGASRAKAAQVLSAMLSDDNEAVGTRATAAEALGSVLRELDRRKWPYKAAIASLSNALESDDPRIRFFSVFALGQLCEYSCLDELKLIASNDKTTCAGMPAGHASVREEAIQAIKNIGRKRRR